MRASEDVPVAIYVSLLITFQMADIFWTRSQLGYDNRVRIRHNSILITFSLINMLIILHSNYWEQSSASWCRFDVSVAAACRSCSSHLNGFENRFTKCLVVTYVCYRPNVQMAQCLEMLKILIHNLEMQLKSRLNPYRIFSEISTCFHLIDILSNRITRLRYN